jgi:hypothetical protein
VEMALEEGEVILKQRTIVEPGEFAEFIDVDESNLDSHQLAVTLTEFMKMKENENEHLVVNAYKKSDDGYIVHLTGEGDMTEFTFASVPTSELANAMNTKERNLKSEMNEEVFAAGSPSEKVAGKKEGKKKLSGMQEEESRTQIDLLDLPKPGTFKNLMEHGGRVM